MIGLDSGRKLEENFNVGFRTENNTAVFLIDKYFNTSV